MREMNKHSLPNVALPRDLIQGQSGFEGTSLGDLIVGTLDLVGGRLTGLHKAPTTGPIKLIFPAPVEAHAHLDKCHTINRMHFTGGDLPAALEAQRADKANWTACDLRTRASRGLQEARAAGCAAIRTHVDWGDTTEAPLAWSVFNELATDKGIDLQLAALTGIDQMADAAFAGKVAAQIPQGHALGSFVLHHNNAEQGIRNAFKAASDKGLALDFHVDEGTDADFNNLETIADAALDMHHQGPVLCGHAVSLAHQPDATRKRIIDKLARAGIFVAALPTTNLYLQGRGKAIPSSRGMTPLRELHDAGVRIVVGTDNVRDAFCPVGRHDPLRALELAMLAGHLDPPLDRWLATITTNASAAIGLSEQQIKGASLSNFRIADASDLSHLISGAAHRPAITRLEELTA